MIMFCNDYLLLYSHFLYLSIVDFLILADVVERFRSGSMDQGRFEVAPSWDAVFSRKRCDGDLTTDPGMSEMIESAMMAAVE